MVVPVPVILKKQDVKTLSRDIFDRVIKAAPRLVEYLGAGSVQGHAPVQADGVSRRGKGEIRGGTRAGPEARGHGRGGVRGRVQGAGAHAQEATGPEAWLRTNKYKISRGRRRCCVRMSRAGCASSWPRSTSREAPIPAYTQESRALEVVSSVSPPRGRRDFQRLRGLLEVTVARVVQVLLGRRGG